MDYATSYQLAFNKERDAILEKNLRTFAVPPIKGEITKGKLKWRGIKLIVCNDHAFPKCWLEQRGRKLEPA